MCSRTTANWAKTAMTMNWNRPGLPVCVHAFLGKKAGGGIAVYQTLPWEVQAWHCGRSGNRTHHGL